MSFRILKTGLCRGKRSICGLLGYVYVALMLSCLASCHCHDEPAPPSPSDEDVMLNLTINMRKNTFHAYERLYQNRALSDGCRRRYIVEAFDGESATDVPADRVSIYQSPDDSTAVSAQLSLHFKKYKIAVWQDYVFDGEAVPYYQTPSTRAIHLPSAAHYRGDTDDKLCASTCFDVDLARYQFMQQPCVFLADTLKCPLARVEFVTTDVAKFVDRALGLASHPDHRDVLQSFTARIVYYAYLPSGFNVVTNKPNDSGLGYQCPTRLVQISQDEARVGFDYILINDHESFVDAQLVIFDASGAEVNRSEPLHIPIRRGGTTYIYDEFLTKEAQPGVSINSDFNGEFNIII